MTSTSLVFVILLLVTFSSTVVISEKNVSSTQEMSPEMGNSSPVDSPNLSDFLKATVSKAWKILSSYIRSPLLMNFLMVMLRRIAFCIFLFKRLNKHQDQIVHLSFSFIKFILQFECVCSSSLNRFCLKQFFVFFQMSQLLLRYYLSMVLTNSLLISSIYNFYIYTIIAIKL